MQQASSEPHPRLLMEEELGSGSFEGDGASGAGGGRTPYVRKGHRKSLMHANLAESLKIRQVCRSPLKKLARTPVSMAAKCGH